MEHRAQLLICHEHIGASERFLWCNLAAHAWCYDCDFYMCEMHLNTRHIEHRTALVGDEHEAPERRSGTERRGVRLIGPVGP